ncbi:hypothetical protein NP233_g11958 [Leucocoprinus birnbaumii]|uniref:Uncharacterized protein n=1 Tax=Leucocoprinus birnbaumii TaxID=56174 RepID=A0AAD5VJ57_9AGAR|nr:hypothetical protein NP233_g11958 [Leucocoprinus birnbaumii]
MANPEDFHIQVELPSPVKQTSPWDSMHELNRVTKIPFIRNARSQDWTHPRDDLLVSAASPAYIEHGLILSQKLLLSPPHPTSMHSLTQHTRGSDLSLEDSEADAEDERPQSRNGDFEDDYLEYDPDNLDRKPEDCRDALIGSHTTENFTELDENVVPPSLTRPTRIRFRSRVRITSGLNRYRHSSTRGIDSNNNTLRSLSGGADSYYCYTPSSSISGSPSSSISAPLRSRTDDEADRPGWGPLGQRVNMLAKKKNRMKKRGSTSEDGYPWVPGPDSAEDLATSRRRVGMTEASPLLIGSSKSRPDSRMMITPEHMGDYLIRSLRIVIALNIPMLSFIALRNP